MKLKAKLPKDDANGLEDIETEFVGNLRNGKVIPALVLLATEDVLERRQEPILTIADIEPVPDSQRDWILKQFGAWKADRTGATVGAVQLDLNDEEEVDQ